MEKQSIKKSELINLQNEGYTRKEIAEKYGVPAEEMNKYFRMLKITGKAKKKLKYAVEDDTVQVAPVQVPQQLVQEVTSNPAI